jgi:peptidoglycan biosynthesis protein MviN/MurJ (putative lipid II flippase)
MVSLLNLLVVMRVLLSLTFQVLILRIFGAGFQTDTYYLSLTAVEFLNALILGFILDFYIPIYNDVKARDLEGAKKFFGSVLLLGGCMEIIIALVLFIASKEVVKIFATGFTEEKIQMSSHLFRIYVFSIPFSGINAILNATLNANFFMFITYLTALFPPLFNIISVFFFAKKVGIEAIVYSYVISFIFNFLILFFYSSKKLEWKFQNPFKNKEVLNLLKQGIPTRIAAVLYNFKEPITTNALSFFPTGYLTIYKYALRIIAIIFEITNSPILNIFYVKASQLVSENKIDELKQTLLSTMGTNTFLFIFSLIPFVIAFDKIFGLLFGAKVSPDQLTLMFRLFLLLALFYLVLSYEMFFMYITYALKSGLKILWINTTFIIFFSFLLFIGRNHLGIYILPVALFLSQSSNAVQYITHVNKKLSIIDYKIAGSMSKTFTIVFFITGFNIFWGYNFFNRILFNMALIILWTTLGWGDMRKSAQYILRKGEIG